MSPTVINAHYKETIITKNKNKNKKNKNKTK